MLYLKLQALAVLVQRIINNRPLSRHLFRLCKAIQFRRSYCYDCNCMTCLAKNILVIMRSYLKYTVLVVFTNQKKKFIQKINNSISYLLIVLFSCILIEITPAWFLITIFSLLSIGDYFPSNKTKKNNQEFSFEHCFL